MNDEQQPQQPSWASAVVTSGESDYISDSSGDEAAPGEQQQHRLFPRDAGQDELYDPDGDEQDEVYVYKNLRGGVTETIEIQRTIPNTTNTSGDGSSTNTPNNPNRLSTERLQALKPRHSDAVLQCPCCFEIICMDCQQHDKYADQFRAMFVMNIAVHWDHVLKFDPVVQGLVRCTAASDNKPMLSDDTSSSSDNHASKAKIPDDDKEHYYQTVCAHCQTQVAALDMKDEVYHFYGCLASA